MSSIHYQNRGRACGRKGEIGMIVFSGCEKEGGFSANLAALGIMEALAGRRAAIIENHIRGRYAGRCMIEEYIRSLEYHNAYVYKGRGTPELPNGCRLVDVWNQRLFYIAQESYANYWLFEHEFGRFLPYLNDMERYCEILYVGAEKNAESTRMLFEKAEIIILNIRQTPEAFEEYLETCRGYLEKTFFLIADYRKDVVLDRARIIRRYGINKGRIAVLPADEEYYRMAGQGEALRFMLHYIRCSSRARHYPFIRGLRDAQKRIARMMEEREGGYAKEA